MNEYDEKSNIRHYLKTVKPYVNMTGIAKSVGVSKQVISVFMRDEHHLGAISLEKLKEIEQFIHNL